MISANKPLKIDNHNLESLKIITCNNNYFSVSYEKNKLNIEQIIDFIKEQNVQIYDISTDDGDLEDVFIRLTKN